MVYLEVKSFSLIKTPDTICWGKDKTIIFI